MNRRQRLGTGIVKSLGLLGLFGGCTADEAECDRERAPICESARRSYDLTAQINGGVRIDLEGDGVDEYALVSLLGEGLTLVWQDKSSAMIRGLGSPRQIARARLDDDKYEDLILTSVDPKQLLFLHSRGDGGFDVDEAVPLGRQARDLEAVDLNGDGRSEALLVDGVRVRIFGPGGAKLGEVEAGASPGSLELGDLDGDGTLDLVVVDHDDGALISLRGDRDGGFGPAGRIELGPSARDLQLADTNGDGILDAVVRDRLFGRVWSATGDGAGGFSSAEEIDLGGLPGDGHGLSSTSASPSGLASITVPMPTEGLETLVIDDAANIIGRLRWRTPTPPTFVGPELVAGAEFISPLRRQAGEELIAVESRALPDPRGWYTVDLAELNGDGVPDIVLGGREGIKIIYGDARGVLIGPLVEGPPFPGVSSSSQPISTATARTSLSASPVKESSASPPETETATATATEDSRSGPPSCLCS